MHGKCKATSRDGSPCSAQARSGSHYCLWHDPELAGQRSVWRSKGGAHRSNAARARKQLSGDLRDLVGVKAALLRAMERVEQGELEPGPAQAMAGLARAIVTVSSAADFEDRIAILEGLLKERRPA